MPLYAKVCLAGGQFKHGRIVGSDGPWVAPTVAMGAARLAATLKERAALRPPRRQYSSGSRNVVTLRSASVMIQRQFSP